MGDLTTPWPERAACRHRTQEWESGQEYHAKQVAIRTCRDACPVYRECLSWVLAQVEDPCPFHVVAGLTVGERRRYDRTGYLVREGVLARA